MTRKKQITCQRTAERDERCSEIGECSIMRKCHGGRRAGCFRNSIPPLTARSRKVPGEDSKDVTDLAHGPCMGGRQGEILVGPAWIV